MPSQHDPTIAPVAGRFGYGVDRVVRGEASLPVGRYALLTNDAARTADAPHRLSRVALRDAGVELVRLFSPEHGVTAAAADGAAVADGADPATELPVVSLYGERLRPAPQDLEGVDGVLIDLPDVGARFYTFLWTMSHVLEGCGDAGVPVWVLDRPNPIGGDLSAAEGPMLDVAQCGSFLGRYESPIRHSLTAGELARLWNAEQSLGVDLQVIAAAGWSRMDHHPATGATFTPTSPSMPCYESALFYPGVCLFEATNLSVGRGTPAPFQKLGALWLDGERLSDRFASLGLPGVVSEPTTFAPTLPPYEGQRCHGMRLTATDPSAVRPVAAGLHLLSLVIEMSHGDFAWSRYPTAANPTGDGHFERLVGQRGVREALEKNGPNLAEQIRSFTAATGWKERVASYLIY